MKKILKVLIWTIPKAKFMSNVVKMVGKVKGNKGGGWKSKPRS